jgi:hypothetical protein
LSDQLIEKGGFTHVGSANEILNSGI